ncbi:MAG: DUF4124 domain-containing protein, partial [Thiohalocapsa sp.]
MKRRSDALRIVVAILATVAFLWFVSTEEQQRQYLVWLGLAESPVRQTPSIPAGWDPVFEFAVASPTHVAVPHLLTGGRRFSTISHDAVGSPCIAAGVVNPTLSSKHQIYRWVDEAGRSSFSDKPPQARQSEIVGQTADGGVGMFSAGYKYLGETPPLGFQRELERNIDGVFRFFERELDLKDVAPLHVNITIIEGKRRFTSYRKKQAPRLATTSGYYSFANNEAVVRWVDHARTLAVARHEISHLALGNWVGITPLWFNEGMAEFLERLEFQQNFARADAFSERIETLR